MTLINFIHMCLSILANSKDAELKLFKLSLLHLLQVSLQTMTS